MKLTTYLFAVAALLASVELGAAQQFSQALIFGDSMVQSGYAQYQTPPLTSGYQFNALNAGGTLKSCGPCTMNSELLASYFGLTAIPNDAPGGGTNYAQGGAYDTSIPAATPTPVVTQIANYLASVNGVANPNALYLISVVGDVVNDGHTGDTASATTAAIALAGEISTLHADGARYFIVPDDYGYSFGTPQRQTVDNAYYNTLYSDLAAAGVNFIPADVNALIGAVRANPAAFGLLYVDQWSAGNQDSACLPPTGMVNPTTFGSDCVNTTTPSANYAYLRSANSEQTSLFADAAHLSAAGQKIEADYFYSLIVAPSEISFLAENAVQATFGMVTGIQQQIDVSQRQNSAGYNAWFNGQLSRVQIDTGVTGFPGDPADPVSGTFGIDYRWPSGWLVGAAVSVGRQTSTFSLGGDFKDNVAALSLYAGYRSDTWWADVIGSYGWQHYDVNRIVPIGLSMQSNTGSTAGSDPTLAGEVGYDFHSGSLTHGPVVGAVLQQVRVNGFTETGSFTSLSFGSQTRNSEVSAIGYRASFDAGIWRPFAQVVWDHEFDSLDRSVSASLTTLAGSGITVNPSYSMPAVQVGRDWGTATIGTTVKIGPTLTGLASFTTQMAERNVTNYGGLVGLNCAF